MTSDGRAPAVVISGASTGIGEACALRLDRLGWRVFAGVRREEDAQRLRGEGSERLTPVMLDVTDQAQIAAARETVAAAVGEAGLAGLVNNAGISVPGPLEFLPLDELRRQLEVNLVGQVAMIQAFASLIRKARGRIVNIGSIGGRSAAPFLGAYNASKFALEAVTDCLRMELLPWGIEVAIVEPGSIDTPIWEKALATGDELEAKLPPEALQLYKPSFDAMRKSVNRFMRMAIPPEEVARVVLHALTAKRPKTRYVVGRDARIQAVLARVAPDRTRDGLIMRGLGLPRKA